MNRYIRWIVPLVFIAAAQAPSRPAGEWPVYAADQAATHYSPLDEITAANVSRLKPVWEWSPGETPLEQYGTRPGAFQNTPLMIDGVLYVSTPYNQVAALDAGTGREIWRYDPESYKDGQPASGQGFIHRGLAVWRDGGEMRIFLNSRHRLIALDARTGQRIESFGQKGEVDLAEGLVWPINRKHYANTSPPVVFRNLVILGNGVGDRLTYKQDPPGDVRAFDVRTGRLVWTFHTIPQRGEFGNNTWDDGSWRFTGHTNVWAPMSLDAERGLLYLPVSTPSNDYYGGRRPGQNLFAETLVCLDAATGRRKWHFQIVHHGLWDYDPPAAPNLVTIAVGGRRIDAVVQLTKQGFAFVFDRVTGKPVWPIEERPVPPSDVPGETAWPTQPFPTRPPPFESQGVTLEDAFDLTPELKQKAQDELRKYKLGPLYTPPSLQGTVALPGVWGGANWGGGAFDPESGLLYVKTTRSPSIFKMVPFDNSTLPEERAGEVDAEWVNRTQPGFVDGVPVLKPPYAHLVAMDLNRGEIRWKVPFGDAPELRALPALAGVALPDRLGAVGPPGAIVTRGGLVFAGGNDMALNAFDKATGREVWRYPLPRQATATPMTYRDPSGRQVVVIATGRGADTALVAFALEPEVDELATWPQFRGPGARGVRDDPALPDAWSSTENVVWNQPVPGTGWSSPIVWGHRVYVTSVVSTRPSEPPKPGLYLRGERPAPFDEHRWMVYALDFDTGRIVWEREAHRGVPGHSRHLKNSYASETPVTDGQRVYVAFGNVGVFAFTMEGTPVWEVRTRPRATRNGWGTAASPVLHDGRLFVLQDNEDEAYLAAFEAASGRELWRVERPRETNWATPLVWAHAGRTEIVTAATGGVRAYDLEGALLWQLRGMSTITIPTPFAADDRLFVASGYVGDSARPVYAVKAGASGDISLSAGTETNDYIAWSLPQGAPYNPSPLVYRGIYYTLLDRGLVTAHDAATGREIYGRQRIDPAAGGFTASPWAANGMIFALNEEGDTYVLRAGPVFEVVRRNTLGAGMTLATPALARGSVILRSASSVFRIARGI